MLEILTSYKISLHYCAKKSGKLLLPALFNYPIQLPIKTVLISYYRMYGRFAYAADFRTRAHRATCFCNILCVFTHAFFDISPHDKIPLFFDK